jgi:hypothetical protein
MYQESWAPGFYTEAEKSAVLFQTDARERLLKKTNAASQAKVFLFRRTVQDNTLSLTLLNSMYFVGHSERAVLYSARPQAV